MKIINIKTGLVLLTSLVTFLLSAQDISSLPNYQLDLIQQSIFNFQKNSDSAIKRVEKFTWAKKSESSVDAHATAANYLSSHYPHVAVLNSQLDSQTKSSVKRSTAVLRYMSELSSGAKIAKYDQFIDNIPVHSKEFNVLLDRNNSVVASSGDFANSEIVGELLKTNAKFSMGESIAIEKAFSDIVGGSYAISLREKPSSNNGYKYFSAQQDIDSISLHKDIRLKKVWYDTGKDIRPAYYVETLGENLSSKQQFAYGHVIGAAKGSLISRMNLVSNEAFTYKVFSKNNTNKILLDGPQGHEWPLIGTDPTQVNTNFTRNTATADYINVTLEAGPISTGDPWLPETATRTEGNNVFSYLDIDTTNGFSAGDITAELTAPLTFDYAFNANATANTDARKTAVVNLFYMNNWLHDWFYDSGFDEVSGNAQANNYGRGGVAGDVLLAEGQDSSGRNNANMSTPSDGGSPRMQMFLYDTDLQQGTDYDLTLNNVPGFTNPVAGVAGFGPQIFASITADVVEQLDATAAPSITDGCEAVTNATDLVGKIALVDRGDCNFTVKVINAQNAGAVAVLVANNVGATQVITMGGDDAAVTIPSLMITQNAGTALRNAIAGGANVSATMFRNATVGDLDGTFDNAIVAHEWGHYISNRLIGNAAGLNNSQGRGMGEGWGDFMAILTFAQESDALVAGNEQYQGLYPMFGWVDQNAYFGIRRAPYTTNFALNSLTFKHIEDGVALPTTHPIRGGSNNAEVHNSGEIWTLALWDFYTRLINDPRYSFEQAQEKMKEYSVASMKMTPVSPTFTEARDAMLAVARADNEDDFLLALAAFAKRGLGTGAVSPARGSSSNSGVVESFETSLFAFDAENIELDASAVGFCSDDNILDEGESAFVKVTIRNTGYDDLINIPVKLSTTADVSLQGNGEQNIASLLAGQSTILNFGVTLNSASVAENINFDLSFPDSVGVIEPSTSSLDAIVNFGFVPDLTRDNEDMQNETLVRHDWEFFVDSVNTVDVESANAAIKLINTSALNSTAALYIEDVGFMADISLVSPELNIGSAPFSVSFDHFYDFENGSWDGGVIEVSEAGGAWVDAISYGVGFTTGYNGTIATNPDSPINTRAAYVNASGGPLSETLNFGTLSANKSIRIRFRMGADANTSGYGWEIDNVQFTGLATNPFSKVGAETMPCSGNIAPVAVLANTAITVTEGAGVNLDASSSTDANGDTLSYQWTQLTGAAVTLTNSTSAIASFTAPDVSQATAFSFKVEVSDGTAVSEATVSVTVNALNQAPVANVASSAITVAEGGSVSLDASSSTDSNSDALSYVWAQTSGPSVSINNSNSALASFTAPTVTANTTLGFEVTVSDGTLEDKAQVTVTVQNQVTVTPPTTTPAPSGGGGGGSLGILSLLLMSLIFFRRKEKCLLK